MNDPQNNPKEGLFHRRLYYIGRSSVPSIQEIEIGDKAYLKSLIKLQIRIKDMIPILKDNEGEMHITSTL
jgi:hypothetical protein